MSATRQCCCGGCSTHDCLSGGTIDTGCCHSCDHLLLWCDRPGFSAKRMALWQAPGSGTFCEICETRTWAGKPPVQAIYQFYGTFWRIQYRKGIQPIRGLKDLLPAFPECPGHPCWGYYPECDPENSVPRCDPQGSQFPPSTAGCVCNSVYSQYQIDRYEEDPDTLWAPELICWKGGANLSASIGRLEDQILGFVHFERWWRIAQGTADCNSYRIVVPECPPNQNGDFDCGNGGTAVQGDDLVPKWWIHACSGVPLFDFDLDDAVANKYISSSDADAVRTAFASGTQPDQQILIAMSQGGYFTSKDWRPEQRQAFVELNGAFPGAGYAACIQNVPDMAQLGPFRRRLTAPFSDQDVEPWLHRDDATATGQTLQVGGACFIDYPGGWAPADEPDYDFWAARQWVYLRGVPGGWTWAGWQALTDPDCIAAGITDEEAALLYGCGRLDPTCIEAIKGWPLPGPTCASCSHPCKCEGITYVNCSCAPSCECSPIPEVGCPFDGGSAPGFQADCDGNDSGFGGSWCNQLGIEPFCQGVRFAYAYYKWEPAFAGNCENCVDNGKFTCSRLVESYLIPARESSNSWNVSVPFKCRPENPPRGVPNVFPAVNAAHQVISPICVGTGPNPINPGQYTQGDFCCGGFCPSFAEGTECCGRREEDCEANNECPPHSLEGQIDCIGHEIECQVQPEPP